MNVFFHFLYFYERKQTINGTDSYHLEALKNMIQNDIIGSINENLRVENITLDDARKLKRLTIADKDAEIAFYKEQLAKFRLGKTARISSS